MVHMFLKNFKIQKKLFRNVFTFFKVNKFIMSKNKQFLDLTLDATILSINTKYIIHQTCSETNNNRTYRGGTSSDEATWHQGESYQTTVIL